MPEPTPAADAEQAPPAAPDTRAALEKMTKADLINLFVANAETVCRATEEAAVAREELESLRDALDDARRGRRGRPEDAMVVSALLDLHRTVEERQGATIRGRSPSIGNRYLEAAKALGDELVEAVLGPAPKA